jgi:hypothetical protein
MIVPVDPEPMTPTGIHPALHLIASAVGSGGSRLGCEHPDELRSLALADRERTRDLGRGVALRSQFSNPAH